jgi:hypothetical protein
MWPILEHLLDSCGIHGKSGAVYTLSYAARIGARRRRQGGGREGCEEEIEV